MEQAWPPAVSGVGLGDFLTEEEEEEEEEQYS